MSSDVEPHLREDYYTPVGAYPVLLEVQHERNRQDEIFGEQNHPIIADDEFSAESREYYADQAELWKLANTFRKAKGGLAWDGILLEEVCEALAETDPARVRAELIQVAAVAVAMIESLDRKVALGTESA